MICSFYLDISCCSFGFHQINQDPIFKTLLKVFSKGTTNHSVRLKQFGCGWTLVVWFILFLQIMQQQLFLDILQTKLGWIQTLGVSAEMIFPSPLYHVLFSSNFSLWVQKLTKSQCVRQRRVCRLSLPCPTMHRSRKEARWGGEILHQPNSLPSSEGTLINCKCLWNIKKMLRAKSQQIYRACHLQSSPKTNCTSLPRVLMLHCLSSASYH